MSATGVPPTPKPASSRAPAPGFHPSIRAGCRCQHRCSTPPWATTWTGTPAPPDDSTCQLAVSCLRIPSVDWSGLPLSTLLLDSIEGDDRDRIAIGPVRETCPGGLTLAWTELRVVEPGEHRECRSRMCLARGDRVQCLITFDFWPEDEARLAPIWDHVLNSLGLGVRTNDPARGRRIE